MEVGYAQKIIKNKTKVWGSKKEYDVIEYEDGSFSCNCPAWIFHKGSRVNCKHILEHINTQMVIQEVKKDE